MFTDHQAGKYRLSEENSNRLYSTLLPSATLADIESENFKIRALLIDANQFAVVARLAYHAIIQCLISHRDER
jgi:hypothetical protein